MTLKLLCEFIDCKPKKNSQFAIIRILQSQPDLRYMYMYVCITKVSTLGQLQGVIFSIKFNDDRSQIVSGSDDRTIRLWNLPLDWESSERYVVHIHVHVVVNWFFPTVHFRSEELCCSLVLYGHCARVWDARLLLDCIVSIGEDATCRVWNLNGQCKEIVRGHKGRSIWSMAIDERQQVIVSV
jgi:WD40 repeat protein